MAHREEEKRQRREERMAAERAAAESARRRRTLQIAGGAVLAVAAVVLIVIAISSSGGDSKPKSARSANTPAKTLPKQQTSDLTKAAAAAGCTLHDYPNFGQEHVSATVNYKSNPPTSGAHNPTPASDGIYDPGKQPAKENSVHALEHGRVAIQYRPGTKAAQIGQLTALFNESLAGKTNQAPQGGYKKLLFENNTGMPYAVAATAWQHLIGCPTFNPRIFDALRAFAVKYVDTAPESAAIPYPE